MSIKNKSVKKNSEIPPVITIRLAEPTDKQAFIDLWKICFEDTGAFVEWFFENRFFPEYSACVEIDSVIVCAMQSMPLPLWIRGKSLPGAIVVGVCTHPDFRGRHLMKNMFTEYMRQMRHKGLLAITYKPENIHTYFSLGHYPTTRTLRLSLPVDYPVKDSSIVQNKNRSTMLQNSNSSNLQPSQQALQESPIRIFTIPDLSSADLRRCFDLYTALAPSYSGMVDRDWALFGLKSRDYASVGGKVLLYSDVYSRNIRLYDENSSNDAPRNDCRPENSLSGYCFYFETQDEIDGEELLAKDDAVLEKMIRELRSLAHEKSLKVKIPSNFSPAISDILPVESWSVAPQNVMGVTDIVKFIQTLDLERFESRDSLRQLVVEVQDLIVPENSVTTNLMGEISSLPACLSIGIGYFVQVLCGYLSLEDFGIVFDKEKAGRIQEVLSPCACFIVDEY